MKQTPNYRNKEDNSPLFAVQLANSRDSIDAFMEILGWSEPDRSFLTGIDHDGETYPLGSWLTVCKCEKCCGREGDPGNLVMWLDSDFHETFEPIDTPTPSAMDRVIDFCREQGVKVAFVPPSDSDIMKSALGAMSEAVKDKLSERLEASLPNAYAKVPDPRQPADQGTPAPKTVMVPQDVAATKGFRKSLDLILQRLKKATSHENHPSKGIYPVFGARSSRERAHAITKIQEAIMWLGMDLKAIAEETGVPSNPYPQSYNAASPDIEPTADGLKL